MLEIEKDQLRERLAKYTILAFRMLPKIKSPHILDVGCGSGIPTLVLAKLSDGEIIGIDTNQSLLDRLEKRAEKLGFSNRVFTKNGSLSEIDFPDETFDIIWAEGSLHIIGFKKALKELNVLLKPDGFLVVHDGVTVVSNNLKKIPDFGYKLINHFVLPDDAWWKDYFEPLEQLIKDWRKKAKSTESLRILESYQREVNMFKTNPKEQASAFCILQKI